MTQNDAPALPDLENLTFAQARVTAFMNTMRELAEVINTVIVRMEQLDGVMAKFNNGQSDFAFGKRRSR